MLTYLYCRKHCSNVRPNLSLKPGTVTAVLLVTFVFVAFPPRDFLANPEPVLSLLAIAIAWGFGLGVIAGSALFALLRRTAASVSAA